jgi:hypothetical protein
MAKPACDYSDMPTNPEAPKKATSRRATTNSFVAKGGKKKKSRKRHMSKK